jgi:pyruvate/2-oxoglutarate dehydrogenase complex dihydrolipoamide acyltransferase (E2) component
VARVAIELAKLGYDMESGQIAAWTRKVGDQVKRGDVIAEIESAKATVEMESLASGTLVEIVHQAGAEVPVGTVIGYLEDGT